MTPGDSEANRPDKTLALLRPVAALGQFTISATKRFLVMVGGMSLLCWAAAGLTLRGIILPGERLGAQSLITQMVRVGVRAHPRRGVGGAGHWHNPAVADVPQAR